MLALGNQQAGEAEHVAQLAAVGRPPRLQLHARMFGVLAKLKEIGTYITKCGCGSDAQPYAVGVCWPEQF